MENSGWLTQFIAMISEAVFLIDPTGTIHAANRAAEELADRKEGGLRGGNLQEALGASDSGFAQRPKLTEMLMRPMSQVDIIRGKYGPQMMTIDSTPVWLPSDRSAGIALILREFSN
jgi:PAS domain-containing protein